MWRCWIVVGLVGAAVVGSPPAVVAASTCEAFGTSDGVSAEAIAWCSRVPDPVVLPPLDCERVSYAVIIDDDTEVAVFPGQVVAGYALEGVGPGVSSAGYDNNYGTALDVLTHGESAPVIGPLVYPQVGERRFSATGRWWRRTCWETDPGTGLLSVGSVEGPFPEGPAVNLAGLIGIARAKVDPPPLPPVSHSGPASLLQLPTWFWIDLDWWTGPYRGEHSHGLVTVSVSAIPRRWQLSADGDVRLRCEGAGLEWTPAAQDGDGCETTFTDAVEGGAVELAVGAELEVAWTASLPGYGSQPLPSIFRRNKSGHEVIEVLALRRWSDD